MGAGVAMPAAARRATAHHPFSVQHSACETKAFLVLWKISSHPMEVVQLTAGPRLGLRQMEAEGKDIGPGVRLGALRQAAAWLTKDGDKGRQPAED